MPLLQSKLGRVLDGHDALVFRNEAAQRVQEGGLSRPSPAAHQMFSRAFCTARRSSSIGRGTEPIFTRHPR